MLKLLAGAALASALLYSLYAPSSEEVPSTSTQSAQGESAPPATSFIARAAMAVGLELPEYYSNQGGCFGEVLSEEKLRRLLATLPPAASAALSSVLAAGEDAWSAQLYGDDQGAGLCLPKREVIVRIPGLSFSDLRATIEGAR